MFSLRAHLFGFLGLSLGGVTATVIAAERVDVLVAYTPAARAYAGSTNAMKAAINTYVAATNTAYGNSDVDVILKLAGAVEATYTEAGSLQTDLQRLASGSDAFLPTVPGLRNTYGADLVCLIRRDGAAGVAGIGYLGNLTSGFAPSAYSVVGDIWAVGNNSFPHELGHNFGCHHDHANGSGAARTYAYGHRFNGTNNVQYRTIMAYAPGSRISYFSNPSITYQGTATGVSGAGSDAADNSRMLEESAVITGAFRDGSVRLNAMVIGDLDNDGHPDALLTDRYTTERYAVLLSNVTRQSTANIGTVGATWRLAATADFNQDGKTDLLWEDTTTGAHVVWLMNGTRGLSGLTMPTIPIAWRIAAAADFNADAKPDLLWENTSTGQRVIWFMNGSSFLSSASVATVAVQWRIAAVADFNADGKPDLVWENTSTGQRMIWYMNGSRGVSSATIATVGTEWTISGAGDFNGDNKPDLAWENRNNNSRIVWYMNGATGVSAGTLPAAGLE